MAALMYVTLETFVTELGGCCQQSCCCFVKGRVGGRAGKGAFLWHFDLKSADIGAAGAYWNSFINFIDIVVAGPFIRVASALQEAVPSLPARCADRLAEQPRVYRQGQHRDPPHDAPLAEPSL
jgi:hypothetical protein